MIETRYFEPRLLAIALAVVGLVAFGPSCSSDKKDGKGGEGGNAGAEICDNEVDDDANGKVDCEDDACVETAHCCPLCGTQCGEVGQAACQTSGTRGPAATTCSPDGACEPAGLVDADGKVRTGEAMVVGKMTEINSTMNYKADQLLVLSSQRPNTAELASCDAVMAHDIDPTNKNQVNVVYEATHSVAEEKDYINVDLAKIPLPKEGQKLILVARFYGAERDINGNPRGDIVGEGCAEIDGVPEGIYEGDEANAARNLEVVIRLFCGGYLDRQCPEPKTCVYGLCRDKRCGSCGPGYTCREWDGVPDCRKACNPDAPDCPNLNRCDATPGEPAVCVPAE